MATDAVLNIRLPKELKDHGNQVLKKNGVSVSSIVRDLYEYMEKEQKIPDCLLQDKAESKGEMRRKLVRELANSIDLSEELDYKKAKEDYLFEKYGESL